METLTVNPPEICSASSDTVGFWPHENLVCLTVDTNHADAAIIASDDERKCTFGQTHSATASGSSPIKKKAEDAGRHAVIQERLHEQS